MKKKKKAKRSNKPQPRVSKWEYFDDCGICQAMKSVEKHDKKLFLEELKDVFEKENNKKPWLKEFISKAPK